LLKKRGEFTELSDALFGGKCGGGRGFYNLETKMRPLIKAKVFLEKPLPCGFAVASPVENLLA